MQILEPSLRRLKALEETLDSHEAAATADGGDDDTIIEKLREHVNKSLVSI